MFSSTCQTSVGNMDRPCWDNIKPAGWSIHSCTGQEMTVYRCCSSSCIKELCTCVTEFKYLHSSSNGWMWFVYPKSRLLSYHK